jgi:hypothetical protein
MSWTYEQSTGRLYSPDGAHVATGYAGGNCGKNPEGVNNHQLQSVPHIGPLPVGIYVAGDVVQQSHLGPFAIPLIPAASNEMFGRSGFFMHGDTTPSGNASEGCIIMPRAVRNEFYESGDVQITVVEHAQVAT